MNDKANILIVDDRSENLLALETILAPLGENLVLANSGKEALRHILKQEFAAILLDARMPEMDGYETATLIRTRANNAHTPIIFITGNDLDDKWIASGYAAGAVDYIVKPFAPEILRLKVIVFIKLYRQARQMEDQSRELQERNDHQRRLLEQNRELEHRLAERAAEAEQRADLLRMLANELVQAEQRERRRLAQVLHDHLQQLLVAVRMKLSLLESRMDDRSLLQEVRDLLSQCMSESRSLTVELSPPVLFDGGLGPAIEWFARHMQEKHSLKLETEAALDVPISEEMRILLFQIIRELVFNSLKHSGESVVRLRAAVNEGCIVLNIEDDGRGFDPRILRDKEMTEAFGLFSIRERLKLFEGRLMIESQPGKGTRARVEIPLPLTVQQEGAEAPASIDADGNNHEREDRRRPGRIRVLIAEDHEIMREGLNGLLSAQSDIEVVGEASNGAMAVELAHSERPDVVIMDVSMPVLNGIEATRRLSREMPGVRVIALSAHHDEAMAAIMTSAGAKEYLLKDDPSENLIAAIRGIDHRLRPSAASARPLISSEAVR